MRKRNWWFFEITGQGHLLKRNRGIDQKTPITRLLRILKKGKNISQEIFISYVLRKHLWVFILDSLWSELPENKWEKVLIKLTKEKIKFLCEQKVNLTYFNENEEEINWPLSEILITLLQQEVYIFLVENAYQNDDFISQKGGKVKEELDKYRKLKEESDKDEKQLGKLLVETWRLFYFSLKIPQKIGDGEYEWKFFANQSDYNIYLMEDESFSTEEGLIEKIVFCHFPWIRRKVAENKYKTLFRAKVIIDKGWEKWQNATLKKQH